MGLMLAATFTLTNCVKEVNQPVDVPSAGIPFEIVASASEDTKTENDGMKTKWTAGDAINLFHAVTGSKEYVSDNSFTITEENLAQGRFKGELGEALDGSKSYDWYAFYPYSSYITTPANTAGGYSYIGHSGGLKQNAYDSMESLCDNVCPLYGIAENVPASELPSVKMNHLTSVVRIRVTNASGSPMTVDNASFTAPEDIVGQYYIGFSTDQPVFTAKSVKNTATVEVTNPAELANGGVADLYLAVKPFTAKTGEEIIITVNGYSKTIKMTKDVTFTAGKIKTVNFSFTAKTATFDFTKPSLYGIEPSTEASKGVEIAAPITVGDVTMTPVSNSGSKVIIFTKSDGETYEMRAYNTDVLSFAVPSGYVIKNMVFKGAKTGDSVFEPNSGVYESKVWTGSANPLDLNLIATANIETITVTYELGTPDAPKQKQTLSFPEESYTATIGSAFTSPVLSGAMTDVTYSSSKEEVATVDDNGVVTLVGSGATVITATAAADETYAKASVSYTLIVNPAPSSSVLSLPWNEDFSGNLSAYTISNGGGSTTIQTSGTMYAGGSGNELMIAKANGSLAAKISTGGYTGTLTLTFKSNHADYLEVTSETSGVEVYKNTVTEYIINISKPMDTFVITLTNVKSSNTRVDDISLVKGGDIPGTNIPTYASLSALVAAGEPTAEGTKVTVTLTNEKITGIYTTGSGYRNGVFVQVGGQEIEIYSRNVPEAWVEGGTISGTLTECVWKLYETTWELCPDDWSELTYTAPEEPEEPGTGSGTTISKTIADIATANGWTNSTQYKTINLDEQITVAVEGGGNTGKYYTSGNNWRLYQSETPSLTISAKEKYKIQSVKITYTVDKTGVLTYNSLNVASGTVVDVNAASITFGVGNTGSVTNGQVRVTAIEVVYQAD